MSNKLFFKGTLILALTGLISRLMGFFYRIFLSHAIGAQGLGIYQLTLPIHGIILAGSSLGIQAAISKICASYEALGKPEKGKNSFFLGSVLGVCLTSFFSFLVYQNARWIAVSVLKESRTVSLLRILSFSFPLSALHSCINSFYYARKKAGFPAFFQLLEQAARIGSTYVIYLIFLSEGKELSPVIAAGGALFSEMIAALVSSFAIALDFHKNNYHPLKRIFSYIHTFAVAGFSRAMRPYLFEIFQIAIPHSANRLLLTVLSGIEMVQIPRRLLFSGLSQADALTVYGIFTGMALPLILFPGTITNSASVMLMPSVASLQALGHENRIHYVIWRTLQTCILFGTGCAFFFFLFGNSLGIFLFHSETAGIYIRTLAFVCPFLYTNTALESILNGLGKTDISLVHNVVGVCVRIGFVFFLIPRIGIRGYFYGMLLSQLLLTFLHFTYLNRNSR